MNYTEVMADYNEIAVEESATLFVNGMWIALALLRALVYESIVKKSETLR